MRLIFRSGRASGWVRDAVIQIDSRVEKSISNGGDLAAIFEQAKANGKTLAGVDDSIDAAIDDPLSYIDYLILDENDEIAFDSEYVREDRVDE